MSKPHISRAVSRRKSKCHWAALWQSDLGCQSSGSGKSVATTKRRSSAMVPRVEVDIEERRSGTVRDHRHFGEEKVSSCLFASMT